MRLLRKKWKYFVFPLIILIILSFVIRYLLINANIVSSEIIGQFIAISIWISFIFFFAAILIHSKESLLLKRIVTLGAVLLILGLIAIPSISIYNDNVARRARIAGQKANADFWDSIKKVMSSNKTYIVEYEYTGQSKLICYVKSVEGNSSYDARINYNSSGYGSRILTNFTYLFQPEDYNSVETNDIGGIVIITETNKRRVASYTPSGTAFRVDYDIIIIDLFDNNRTIAEKKFISTQAIPNSISGNSIYIGPNKNEVIEWVSDVWGEYANTRN